MLSLKPANTMVADTCMNIHFSSLSSRFLQSLNFLLSNKIISQISVLWSTPFMASDTLRYVGTLVLVGIPSLLLLVP